VRKRIRNAPPGPPRTPPSLPDRRDRKRKTRLRRTSEFPSASSMTKRRVIAGCLARQAAPQPQYHVHRSFLGKSTVRLRHPQVASFRQKAEGTAARAGASTFPPTSASAWPPTLTATQDGRLADSPPSDPDDCFHCPQGDQPCPVTYQPGAWLAPPAEPTAAVPDRPRRVDELDASIQQALRNLYEALAGDPRWRPAGRGEPHPTPGTGGRSDPG
jgi:hypothetical protein